MTRIEIEVARHAGVCYGVERALGMAEKAAREAAKPVNTLGPLIHNPLVVSDLERIGVGTASSVDEVDGGTVIIRAHGVVPSVVEDARHRGLDVLDATCPYVKKVHNAAERLVREGYQLIDASVRLRSLQPVQARKERQVLTRGQIAVKHRLVRDETDAGTQSIGLFKGIGTENPQITASRPRQKGKLAQKRGLSGAIGAKDGEERALW